MIHINDALTALLCETIRFDEQSRSTIGEGGDTTIPSPGRSPKQPLPGIGLHDPLHGRQACPGLKSFYQGVGQICPRVGLFSCRPLQKRGQICYIPAPPPPPIVERVNTRTAPLRKTRFGSSKYSNCSIV